MGRVITELHITINPRIYSLIPRPSFFAGEGGKRPDCACYYYIRISYGVQLISACNTIIMEESPCDAISHALEKVHLILP